MAEISVPACPIPIHHTKFTMAKPQPIGMVTPQMPTPRANKYPMANNIIMVCLFMYAILGLLADGAVRLVERRALAWRREFAAKLKAAGAKKVEVERVVGESHVFDLPPNVGTTDMGPKWQSVLRGLDFLSQCV